ncbi:peptidase S8/S53 domain-containing protein [Syncephalis pseudoplumigaleata]|uniref:Peptidase S8/S53 domain-containing protein n=1 Tax=Syncephalis pseudoplumigaleata TaxID=1712513 RepID=A0A4P9YY74_9FUNG|nr:peptidase S8/S53 domain-containing protein [Syncephalis pseudoplumigaleata]|eukprot:RKP24291.1 peptidase S8/S53 domain-containing protein [Syncephalis pseudoplumigaleata]
MDMSPRYYQQVTALLVAEKAGIDVIFGRSTDRFGELDKVVMSDSSAWGPELRHVYLKPDVVAPGDDIYTTFLTNSVSYMRNRGTSLSAPYVAGAIALYLGRYYGHRSKHDFLPKKMRHIIQNSAYPLKDPKRGWEPIARQGAGLLDVEKMFTGTIRVEPSAFSLGNYNSNKWSPNGVRYKSIRITNLDKVKHTYELSHHKMPFILKAVNPETTRLGRNEKPSTYEPAFDVQSLTIGPNKTKVVRVRFTEPVGIDRRDNWLCSGYIVITRQPNLYGSALTDDTVVVPYQGLWGYIGSFENAMK